MKRKRLLDLQKFLSVFIRPMPATTLSLNDMCREISDEKPSIVSKQALHKRINSKSAELLLHVLELVLETKCRLSGDALLLPFFTAINLTDSTCIELPSRLKDAYPGFGGSAGETAGVKIQYQVSLTDGRAILEIVPATTSDQKTNILTVRPRELHLFDLGYVDLQRLQSIKEQGAFYLCKMKSNTTIWVLEKNAWKKLSMADIATRMRGKTSHSLTVYLGEKKQLKTRLIISPLNKTVADKKRRRAKYNAQKHGRTATQEYLKACQWSLLITNAPPEHLPASSARAMYSLRWQVETYFKTWKSYMHLHNIHPMNEHRFKCHLYGVLVYIILAGSICWLYKLKEWTHRHIELSDMKMMKYLAGNNAIIRSMIHGTLQEEHLVNMEKIFLRTCRKERRKGAQTPMDIMFSPLS